MMKSALFAVVLVLFFATGVITLMGIIQRVEIERKYLNALFSALILELIAAVLFLFSATDFFVGEPLSELDLQKLAALEQYDPQLTIAQLDQLFLSVSDFESKVQSLQSERDDFERKHANALLEISTITNELDGKTDQVKWLNGELEARKEAVVRLAKLERQFLVRMSELNSKISEWGSSINFRWQPDDKRDVALMLQEGFKEIGFMKELEIPNNDPLLAHEILMRYQTEKRFKETGFLTHQTIAFIIQDYLESANGR